MYFHNKLIWSHKCEYYLLETWVNVNHFTWHATHSCILSWTEVVPCHLRETGLKRLTFLSPSSMLNPYGTLTPPSPIHLHIVPPRRSLDIFVIFSMSDKKKRRSLDAGLMICCKLNKLGIIAGQGVKNL